ncbi:hypothetical protein Acr_13g0009770 [Actinidia rufa]|uniref:Uncharacterized protein n=1 Tax=Actinidia rufa TaxID=165716 RepID=A0A7J0FNT5_9ERIC|nr:hypothetical protein Acr_13g0009770 [Actinidia rufa]
MESFKSSPFNSFRSRKILRSSLSSNQSAKPYSDSDPRASMKPEDPGSSPDPPTAMSVKEAGEVAAKLQKSGQYRFHKSDPGLADIPICKPKKKDGDPTNLPEKQAVGKVFDEVVLMAPRKQLHFKNEGKLKSASGNTHMRKVLCSRHFDFFKAHSEGEVPEETLPEPFNQSKQDVPLRRHQGLEFILCLADSHPPVTPIKERDSTKNEVCSLVGTGTTQGTPVKVTSTHVKLMIATPALRPPKRSRITSITFEDYQLMVIFFKSFPRIFCNCDIQCGRTKKRGLSFRLYLVQGFSEGKENGKGEVGEQHELLRELVPEWFMRTRHLVEIFSYEQSFGLAPNDRASTNEISSPELICETGGSKVRD